MSTRARRVGDQTFRKNDLRRALATAADMRLRVKGIVVNESGFELIVNDAAEPAAMTEAATELDQWVAKKKK
jgi:hypothetical protein